MKGIILAGGTGSRLYPLTIASNKQLLPVYDKPMIFYSLTTLINAGIRDIMIISSINHIESYQNLFGKGTQYGLNIAYRAQMEPKGIAEAFIIGENWIGKENVCLILGDNVFHGEFYIPADPFLGAVIYAYKVKDPSSYGVIELDGGAPISIVEKPKNPISNLAIPGLYFFDYEVCEYAKRLKPSARGELEITDIMKEYMRENRLRVIQMNRGVAWLDAGTPESLFQSSAYIQAVQERTGLMVGCIEEACLKRGFISKSQLNKHIELLPNGTSYRKYLEEL
jgi:glucose-1-phosphate thymidylyltransferase